MKRGIRVISIILTLICIVGSIFTLSACNEYKFDKYENISYGDYERQTLNLYIPQDCGDTVGLILVIHGGAWIGGDKDYYDGKLETWCKSYGYAAAAINYHFISEEFSCEDILNDITLSLEKIKAFALEKGVNIQKCMLTGNSAGGHLSLLYAYKCADTAPITPVAVANYSGPTDLTDQNYYVNNENASGYLDLFSKLCHTTFTADNYLLEEMQAKLLEYSPVNYVTQNTVPTLICHGDADEIVPYSNATILKQKLDSYGVKNDFVSYKNSGHSLSGDKKSKRKANDLFESYANKYLG